MEGLMAWEHLPECLVLGPPIGLPKILWSTNTFKGENMPVRKEGNDHSSFSFPRCCIMHDPSPSEKKEIAGVGRESIPQSRKLQKAPLILSKASNHIIATPGG